MNHDITVDALSRLCEVEAHVPLRIVENLLSRRGLTLGLSPLAADLRVGEWLARGAPGARSNFHDPADHLLAGFTATLPSGEQLRLLPSPRRSAGPDLSALLVGTQERYLTLESVWLRVFRSTAERPTYPLPAADLDPPVSDDEEALLDAIAGALGAGPPRET